MKRALQDVVRVNDYNKAIDIRNEILKHQKKRENFEMIYETSKWEESLILGEPSQAYKEQMMLIELEEYERREAIIR